MNEPTDAERLRSVDEAADEEARPTQDSDGGEIRDTDIVFDCPHCGHGLVIDYRGAGLITNCTECGKPVQVPIPDGMVLTDLDQPPEEIEAQVVNMRRALFKAEQRVHELESMVTSLKERRTALEKTRAAELHRLAEIRSVCEHMQRMHADMAASVTRMLDLIASELR